MYHHDSILPLSALSLVALDANVCDSIALGTYIENKKWRQNPRNVAGHINKLAKEIIPSWIETKVIESDY